MDTQNNQQSLIPQSAISDLALVLKDKGLTESEVNATLMDIASEVQVEVAEALMESLSDEQKAMLDAMIKQKKSDMEIAEALKMTPEDITRLEAEKFRHVLTILGPSIGLD